MPDAEGDAVLTAEELQAAPGEEATTGAISEGSTSLWKHPNFLKLWGAQTVSQIGTQITWLAIPITAALTLQVSPAQMGILRAVQTVPYILLGVFAGALIDRNFRRPVLIATDLARGFALAIIPLTALLGVLRLDILYAVGFLVGAISVFFDAAYRAYLPSLVPRNQILDGNSKLEITRSGAQVLAPGLAGALLQVITAPFAIAVDVASYFVSAIVVSTITAPEPPPESRESGGSLWEESLEGLRVVFSHRLLRSIAGCSTTINLFSSAITAILVFYITRQLRLSPQTLGIILMSANVGFLLGAALAQRVALRIGTGPAIFLGAALASFGQLLYAAAGGSELLTSVLLAAAQFIAGFGASVYNVNQMSLRQIITPDRLQGRVNATVQMLSWVTMPVGALLGGMLSQTFGMRPTLAVCSAAVGLGLLWLVFSPMRRLSRANAVPAELMVQ